MNINYSFKNAEVNKNAIILLDEPGLHLHAAAQKDFLARLKEYAKDNQLI